MSAGPWPRSWRERPEQFAEVDVEVGDGARVGDGGLDLRAVPHNARVVHQPLDVAVGVARDLVDVEPVECATEILPLTQDDQPRQSALEGLEADPLEQRLGAPQRLTPFGVVVVPVEDEIGWRQTRLVDPTATDAAVVVWSCRHVSALSSDGSACAPPSTGSSPSTSSPSAPGRLHRRQLTAQQVEFLAEPVQHPVDLTGLVTAQRLGELDRVDVGAGDARGGQHRRGGGAGQRRQHLAAPEQRAAHTEQHDGHQDQYHEVQQDQGHALDPASPVRRGRGTTRASGAAARSSAAGRPATPPTSGACSRCRRRRTVSAPPPSRGCRSATAGWR